MRKSIIVSLALSSVISASAVSPLWVRDVKISPDGTKVAFTYKGAIYSVPAEGGKASRLTTGNSLDMEPVWSPDGKKIAFSSDREGGSDVFIMNADGSNPVRLTFNSAAESPEAFSADGKRVIFSAAISDPASSALFPNTVNKELYSVPVEGGRVSRILATPAVDVELVPGTDKIVFEGVKGSEDQWRKHHTSSVTRDIWSWSPSAGYVNLTSRAGEDRDPSPSADGKTLYFLSERDGGSSNIYSMPIDGKGEAVKLTDYKSHPVRFLSRGGDNLLAFTYNGEAFTMKPGEKPKKLAIDVIDSDSEGDKTVNFASADESLVSPDGNQVAFTKRGEVFVTSVKYPSTRQITHTAAAEGQLAWGKDGRDLYYTSYRSGRPEIYKASISRKEDPNFSNATLVEEAPLFKDSGVERSNPSVSPDGKTLVYLEGRSILKAYDLASGKTKTLTPTPPSNYRSGSFPVSWSPDSKWIAIEYMNPLHEPYSDIAVISLDNAEMIPLTRTGYFDQQPRFSPDGKAVLFVSDRYGMRSHASWGSESDVMAVFLTKDAYDRFLLSEEDLALLKEVEKEQKKAKESASKDTKDKDKKDNKDAKEGDKVKVEENLLVIDRDGLEDRVVRLTPASSSIRDYILTNDGENLYYMWAYQGGLDLWKKNLRKGDVQLVRKIGPRGGSFQTDAQGNIFLAGGSVSSINAATGAPQMVNISGSLKINPVEERSFMLDYVANEARERFYLKDMPVDWNKYVENYRRFLPHINNNHDFAELLSELLGELNVSHSGGRYRGAGPKESTASLGLFFDENYKGDGLKVTEIVAGGPFDRATTSMKAGDIVTAINGEKISAADDWSKVLNGIVKKKTLVSFKDASGKENAEVILPISAAQLNGLLYDRWVKGREALVDSLSGGRLGYVHLQSMSDGSFRTVYAKLLGEYMGKDGVVIDTRWNGGGRLHEDIEVLFSGEKYLTQEIHGRKSSEMPSRRWNKPSIMVTGEANYSNAHGTPWVYKHKNLGKIVGMPVPGTMSSVNWIDLQDPEVLFGVPVVAFRTNDGTVLENTQLEPDIKVENLPGDVVKGIDTQIEVAVRELLKEIDARK